MLKKTYDVAVIGGGAAGIMAAGKAAESGAKTILIEKNNTLGKKLLITGKGRCNITNAEFDLKKMIKNYGEKGKFLFNCFSVFGVKDTIDFFEKLSLKTKIERGKRVFPVSDKSESVLKVLIKYLKENNVVIKYNTKVIGIKKENNKIQKIVVKKNTKEDIIAKKYILCTGGKSYPLTGSSGDGFKWAKKLGHTIEKPVPSLTPIKTEEKWVKSLQGLSLKNVQIKVEENNKKILEEFGECLFTHFGLSGPVILDISRKLDKKKNLKLIIDLKPALDFNKLDKRIIRDFEKHQNKAFRNSLDDLLPKKMTKLVAKMSGINLEKKSHSITKKERHNLVNLLKNIQLTVTGLMGFDYAIITSGGVSLKEINEKSMKSKIIDNLFFAGEIIDIDGPTGGYNLQVCWSTGYLAGKKKD